MLKHWTISVRLPCWLCLMHYLWILSVLFACLLHLWTLDRGCKSNLYPACYFQAMLLYDGMLPAGSIVQSKASIELLPASKEAKVPLSAPTLPGKSAAANVQKKTDKPLALKIFEKACLGGESNSCSVLAAEYLKPGMCILLFYIPTLPHSYGRAMLVSMCNKNVLSFNTTNMLFTLINRQPSAQSSQSDGTPATGLRRQPRSILLQPRHYVQKRWHRRETGSRTVWKVQSANGRIGGAGEGSIDGCAYELVST